VFQLDSKEEVSTVYLLILWQEIFIFAMGGGGGLLLAHRIMQEFCLYYWLDYYCLDYVE